MFLDKNKIIRKNDFFMLKQEETRLFIVLP